MSKGKVQNDPFVESAENMVIYKLKTSWLQISKCYDAMAAKYDATLSMAFLLTALNEEEGTPVTKIAPRIGMEPNSLSRVLKNLLSEKLVVKKHDKVDKRKVLICLTESGKQKRKLALKAVFNLESMVTQDHTDKDLQSFFKVVNSIPKAIEQFNNLDLEIKK